MNAGEPPAALFRRLIATQGPISLQQYMGEANARYYAARDPLGSAGDFVTAPEISQMFGELVGLWLADIWQRAGSPSPVHYVELGPGRGTLAKDALRAAGRAGLTPTVHFVEASPALRAVQRAALPHAQWHDDLAMVPDDAPLLIVANEFLDALPVRQLVKTADGWRERMVGIEAERFVPVSGALPMDAAVPAQWREARDGTILETCPGAAATVQEIARRLAVQGGAALLIDYGHTETRTGSTLQAVRAHAARTLGKLDSQGQGKATADALAACATRDDYALVRQAALSALNQVDRAGNVEPAGFDNLLHGGPLRRHVAIVEADGGFIAFERVGHADHQVRCGRHGSKLAVFLEDVGNQRVKARLVHVRFGGNGRHQAPHQLDIAGHIALELGAQHRQFRQHMGALLPIGDLGILPVEQEADDEHHSGSNQRRDHDDPAPEFSVPVRKALRHCSRYPVAAVTSSGPILGPED